MECDEEDFVLTLVAKPELERMSGEIEISLDDGVNDAVPITIEVMIFNTQDTDNLQDSEEGLENASTSEDNSSETMDSLSKEIFDW